MHRKEGLNMRSVLLVEDEERLRSSFAQAISASGDFVLAAAVASVKAGKSAFDLFCPDIVLVDLGLPDGSGIDIIRHVATHRSDCLVMVVSVFGDERNVVASIEAGAVGYVLKDTADENFLGAIRDMVAGGAPISPGIARHLLARVRSTGPGPVTAATDAEDVGLSDREREILNLTAKGYTFPEIAKLLDISLETIKTHIKRVYQKLAVHSKGEAVYEAQRLGLLPSPHSPPR
jgi:DNA-binding NarL/FixJ family response regulator